MKLVILAGGLGTRISEETNIKPKPMIEIGGKPILWHIMKIYSAHGINEFIICCGYKGYVIKEYFANYYLHMSDVTIDLKDNSFNFHNSQSEPWKVTLVETGEETMTGGRLLRVREYLKNEKTFCFTYGDGVGNIDITSLLKFHQEQGLTATLTATTPPGRFGALEIDGEKVKRFIEKPSGSEGKINGGFFVLNSEVFDLIDGDDTIWEREPLEVLAQKKQLASYKHDGFWHPMDTLRDKIYLEELWVNKKAPWKIW
jgi:glucose-1-phosphate cytidylyltransferase